ncbi:MAG: hypothetical protein WCX32_04815 [Clostridia bacterium]|jgi:hypothetical protein|nr:hypothetical protein [Clostridia bacterium]
MAELEELKEKLESLENIRENLSKKRNNTTKRVDKMRYYTIGGAIRAGNDSPSINYAEEVDATHMPFKWVKESWKNLVSPDFPRGVINKAFDLLQLLLSVTFLIATTPIWVVDNTVSGSVFLINKASLKGNIKATEKKLAVIEQQIYSVEAEIRNIARATKLANTFKNEPKHFFQVESIETKQSEKSEENSQDE